MPETLIVEDTFFCPCADGHEPDGGAVGDDVGVEVGLDVGDRDDVGDDVGVVPPAYVSNSATCGVDDALVISNVSFFSDVELKLMVPAPLPVFRTEPESALISFHAPIRPLAPDVSTMLADDTVVAEPHLIEMLPVEPLGDQYVLREPSLTLP